MSSVVTDFLAQLKSSELLRGKEILPGTEVKARLTPATVKKQVSLTGIKHTHTFCP